MTIPQPRAEGAGKRKGLSPAMLAALWTVSNGRCYAPGCPMPVVLEVRPGYYQKNAQVAHIYGVKPGAARHRPDMPDDERDSFANLLLLCLAHHEEVDGEHTRHRYPPETLRKWKTQHEGAASSVLNNLKVPNVDALMSKLVEIAEPPLERLEAITQRLEETGTVTAETVAELKQIIEAMSTTGVGVDAHTANALSYAAEVLGTSDFSSAVSQLSYAAEVLGTSDLSSTASQLSHVAEVLPQTASQLESVVSRASEFY